MNRIKELDIYDKVQFFLLGFATCFIIWIGFIIFNNFNDAKKIQYYDAEYSCYNKEVIKEENLNLLVKDDNDSAIINLNQIYNIGLLIKEVRKLYEEEQMTLERKTVETTEHTEMINIEDVQISRDMDPTQRTGLTKEQFVELMNNLDVDYSDFFTDNSELIYDLCEEYQLNEIFFCGLIAAESGWEIKDNHRRTNNYISMMSGNGKLLKYDSVEEGLEAAARHLHDKYLTEEGSYYHGETIAGVKKCFCPSSDSWEGLVYGCMKLII